MFPPFSCSASTAKVLLLAGLNRFRFLAAGHASGANFSGLKNEYESRKLVYTTEPDTLNYGGYLLVIIDYKNLLHKSMPTR